MQEKYLSELEEIKSIMQRSSRFLTLSGLSGISVGILALIGSYLAYQFVYKNIELSSLDKIEISSDLLSLLVWIAAGTLILAILVGSYFTNRAAKKQNINIWDIQTRRFLLNFSIPLFIGGVLCIILLIQGFLAFLVPLTLIFQGLALVQSSRYSLSELRSLGFLMIVLGIAAMLFVDLGLIFWALGFGVLHIVYGLITQLKYQK